MNFSDEEESYRPLFGQEETFQPNYGNQFLESEDRFENSISEAERRLEMANYYKCIIRADLFGADDSPIAKAVQLEMRNYATDRLETLMGIKQESSMPTAAPSAFTEDEIRMLKAMASTAARVKSEDRQPQLTPVSSPHPSASPVVKSPPKIDPIQTSLPAKTTPKTLEQKKELAKKTKSAKMRPMPTPPGAIPMPQGHQMTEVSAMQAQAQVGKLNAVTSELIATALNTPVK